MIDTLKNGAKIRSTSWRDLSAVIDHLDKARGIFRHRTVLLVSSAWEEDEHGVYRLVRNAKYIDERHFTYWAEKLVAWGLCEKRVKSRGWYTWTLYRLKQSYGDTMDALGGIPF
jgi:hypothetical protein